MFNLIPTVTLPSSPVNNPQDRLTEPQSLKQSSESDEVRGAAGGRPQSTLASANPTLFVLWALGNHRHVGREWGGQVCILGGSRGLETSERKPRGSQGEKGQPLGGQSSEQRWDWIILPSNNLSFLCVCASSCLSLLEAAYCSAYTKDVVTLHKFYTTDTHAMLLCSILCFSVKMLEPKDVASNHSLTINLFCDMTYSVTSACLRVLTSELGIHEYPP